MAGGNHLIEQIRTLLVEGQVPKLVTDKKGRLGIEPELANERMIDLRGQQMVEHVHGGCKQDTLIGLTGLPTDDFRQKCFAHAWVAEKDRAIALCYELQIEEAQNAGFELHAALMVFELKAVDGVLRMQSRSPEASLDGPTVAGFQFDVDKGFERFGEAAVSGCVIRDRLIQLLDHRGQAELVEFLVQCGHGTPFRTEE